MHRIVRANQIRVSLSHDSRSTPTPFSNTCKCEINSTYMETVWCAIGINSWKTAYYSYRRTPEKLLAAADQPCQAGHQQTYDSERAGRKPRKWRCYRRHRVAWFKRRWVATVATIAEERGWAFLYSQCPSCYGVNALSGPRSPGPMVCNCMLHTSVRSPSFLTSVSFDVVFKATIMLWSFKHHPI